MAKICPGNKLLNGDHTQLLSTSGCRFDHEVTTHHHDLQYTCRIEFQRNWTIMWLSYCDLTIFQMGDTCHPNF